MSKLTPYRELSVERRLSLVTFAIKSGREGRDQFIQRLVERGGGFRPATLKNWDVLRLASEIVRRKAESATDELDLLQMLYVDLEPATQITFLDAASVAHEGGKMADSLEPPYADAEAVQRGAAAVRDKHGQDGEHYLRTIARYSGDAWPGIDAVVSEAEG